MSKGLFLTVLKGEVRDVLACFRVGVRWSFGGVLATLIHHVSPPPAVREARTAGAGAGGPTSSIEPQTQRSKI